MIGTTTPTIPPEERLPLPFDEVEVEPADAEGDAVDPLVNDDEDGLFREVN